MLSNISLPGLVIAFLPAVIVIALMYRWRANVGTAVHATARMLLQLLAIGYVLVYIFRTDHFGVIVLVLVIMNAVASGIAIRHLQEKRLADYLRALAAIAVSSMFVLLLVTQAVIGVEPWFSPRFVVPLAGMIIAGSMNAVGLAAERFQAETERGESGLDARRTALQASLIPIVNSLFAVGVVSLPGMMTGQILSGVSPLIAAKYQIVVMAMLFGASGMASMAYLYLRSAASER